MKGTLPRFETVAIGDELLTGRITDTNSTYVANSLFGLGWRLSQVTVVADELKAIQSALLQAKGRADFVICFGGLGPTSDDKTAEAVADLLRCPLVTHEPSRQRLLHFLAQRGRELNPTVLKQVHFPKRTQPLDNLEGLAPGFSYDQGGCRFYFLPGVPSEMEVMFSTHVLPELQKHCPLKGQVLSHAWRCLGIPESELQRLLDPVEAELRCEGGWMGYRTTFPENHLTLYLPEECGPDRFHHYTHWIDTLVLPWCYSRQGRELEEEVISLLEQRSWKIALAESCTGGLVVQRLTRVPGASRWVWGGYVPYRPETKSQMLGVEVTANGAVSAACTRQLAEETLRRSQCQMSAAITGYLGPLSEKTPPPPEPIGTIYLCVMAPSRLWEKALYLPHHSRKSSQWSASAYLLDLIRRLLLIEQG